PTATKEIQYLNAKGALTYTDIAGDPVLYGNLPPREISMKDVFRSGDSSKKFKIAQASAVLDLTEDDFDFLTSNKVWIATDRSRARRCVEACVYGTLDFVGYPRFPAPVEFIAAVIAYYVHPVNIQTACLIMEGAEFTE